MESNDESSSKFIEEILLTSEDEEEILIDSDTTNDIPEVARSSPVKRDTRKFEFVYEDISSNTNDSENNPASESYFLIPHSDSDIDNFELIEDLDDSMKKTDDSNHSVHQETIKQILSTSLSIKLDENNNINDPLFSTSTPNSDALLARFNDSKIFQPCSVVLQRVTEDVIQSFKPKSKKKYEITYKKQSDEESNWSNASTWSAGRKKKFRKQNWSTNSLNASVSTSSASSVKQKKMKNETKNPKRAKKTKESLDESTEPKLTEFLNEETNTGFENSNYVCQISNNERIKLKICKSQIQKEVQAENEETSNHTIMLASSRSNSPIRPEPVTSKTTLKPPTTETNIAKTNETAKIVKKNDNLLKTTLKKHAKVKTTKKCKTPTRPKLDGLSKPKENLSIKKSIIGTITDIAIDRSYRIPKLNRKEDTGSDLEYKPKQTNGKNTKKNTKKTNDKKETRPKPTTSSNARENNVEIKKRIKKCRNGFGLMTRDQIPKLRDLQRKRAEFNQSIGAKYPYFSILYIIDEYVKKMSTVPCLDFDLLLNNSLLDDSELSISCFNREEQIQLCRLMSRSAGRVNLFELVNMDPMLREHQENFGDSWIEPVNTENADEYFLNLMDDLTISEAYILYKRYLSRLNSPYRAVELIRIANTDTHTLHVTFENDFEIESLDLSIESVVIASLHKPLKKLSSLRNDIHLNSVYIDEDSNSSNEKLVVTAANYDSIRIKLNDDELVNKIYTKSVYEKYCHMKMPKNFYKTCNTEKNPKPCIDDTRKERFLGHRTHIRTERGEMRIANRHRILTDYEFEERLLRLQTEQEIQIDLSQLKKKSVN